MWNASRQDHTQWNGGVPNGLFIQALARNTGEVFGVFADFKPKVHVPAHRLHPRRDPYNDSSADFAGLQTLEEKISTLQPPPWPRDIFGLDEQLAAKGKPLFDTNCGECHGERPSPKSVPTPGTRRSSGGHRSQNAVNSVRESKPGLYAGSLLPPPPFNARFVIPAKIGDILASSVVGSLLRAMLPVDDASSTAACGGQFARTWRSLPEKVPTI